MKSRLCNFFDSIDSLTSNIKTEIDDETHIDFCYNSTKYFTMNGAILSNILQIETSNTDNIIKLQGPNSNSLIILMYSDEIDENTPINDIWNWKVFYCILQDNYFIIDEDNPYQEKQIVSADYKINSLDSIQALYNILYKNIDLENFRNELLFISKWDKKTHTKEIINQALSTAIRVVLLGNKGVDNFGNKIITDIDGENIYNHNLDSLSLDLYNSIKSSAKQGSNRHTLFTFSDIHKKSKKNAHNTFLIDGIPMSNLIDNGLIEELNSVLKTEESGIKLHYNHLKKKGIGEIYVDW